MVCHCSTLLNANDLYVKEMAAFALAETCRENRDNQTLAAELLTARLLSAQVSNAELETPEIAPKADCWRSVRSLAW